MSCKANLIEYEFLDIPPGLNILINQKKSVGQAFFVAGKVLATIHSYKNIGLKHSDYCLHNLFFDGKCLFIIDNTPPCWVPWKDDMLKGDGKEELIQFAYSSFSSVGFQKSITRYNRLYSDLLFFLNGYFQKKELPAFKIKDFYLFFLKYFTISPMLVPPSWQVLDTHYSTLSLYTLFSSWPHTVKIIQ